MLIAMLFAVALHPAQAQSAKPAAKPAARPAAVPVAQPAYPVNPAEQADYWTVNTALPSQYATDNTRQLGRVPLRDAPGSIGFTSGQSASSGQFHDGRTVPGLNPNTQKESSYVGVSLSVTSANKGFPLVPVPTPWGRPE
jgi:hypothetical protein